MMKKILFIALTIVGINCHGQTSPVKQNTMAIDMKIDVLTELFNQMLSHVNSLEKRITELESKCVVIVQDSVPCLYHTWGDSLVIEYGKRQIIAPYKKQEKYSKRNENPELR